MYLLWTLHSGVLEMVWARKKVVLFLMLLFAWIKELYLASITSGRKKIQSKLHQSTISHIKPPGPPTATVIVFFLFSHRCWHLIIVNAIRGLTCPPHYCCTRRPDLLLVQTPPVSILHPPATTPTLPSPAAASPPFPTLSGADQHALSTTLNTHASSFSHPPDLNHAAHNLGAESTTSLTPLQPDVLLLLLVRTTIHARLNSYTRVYRPNHTFPHPPTMSAWYSNIVTKTTSQISSLRSTLLSGEADGDTEDDTHVCRVLRNYYTDKGRPRPNWLPPDPKAANQAPQPLYAQPQAGSRYGGFGQQSSGSSAGGGGLSSLWDNGPAQQQQAPPAPQSLRAGRGPPAGNDSLRPSGSQRSGSYTSVNSASGGGSSAQDRLKQRLYGGRSASPAQNSTPPPANGGQYSGGGGGQSQWGNGSDPYGGTGTRNAGGGQQRQGLPSGPRGYR